MGHDQGRKCLICMSQSGLETVHNNVNTTRHHHPEKTEHVIVTIKHHRRPSTPLQYTLHRCTYFVQGEQMASARSSQSGPTALRSIGASASGSLAEGMAQQPVQPVACAWCTNHCLLTIIGHQRFIGQPLSFPGQICPALAAAATSSACLQLLPEPGWPSRSLEGAETICIAPIQT